MTINYGPNHDLATDLRAQAARLRDFAADLDNPRIGSEAEWRAHGYATGYATAKAELEAMVRETKSAVDIVVQLAGAVEGHLPPVHCEGAGFARQLVAWLRTRGVEIAEHRAWRVDTDEEIAS